jgi:hypothetical protein
MTPRFALVITSALSGCCYVFGPGEPFADSEEITVDCFTAQEWLADGDLSDADCTDVCGLSGLTEVTASSCQQLSTCGAADDTGADTGPEYPPAIRVTCDGMRKPSPCY